MLKKLRIKFVVINMSIVTVMLCLVFGMVLHFTKQNLEQSSLNMMRTAISRGIKPDRPDSPPEDIRLPFFLLTVGPQGNVAAFGGGYYDLSDDVLIKSLHEISAASDVPVGIIDEYKLRFMRVDMPDSQLILFADISSEISTMKNLTRNCILIGLMSFCIFLAVSILLARWAVKPVDEAWTKQRQFIADASHELKTPLTVIISNAELLQDPSFDESSRSGFSESILIVSKQMRRLVESLLDLARVDTGSAQALYTSTDFSAAVYESVLAFEALFYEKGLELKYKLEDAISIHGSKVQLKQITDILLDNAQKYSTPGTEVSLSLKKESRHALLKVSSCGEEISEEDLKNIFKRFWRQDKARSSNGGFGLGLSIAESIVKDHKGKIWAESKNGTNSFYIQLPLN